MSGLGLAALFLAAAAFFAPVAKRLGLSSIIGYLIAGVLIGPSGFALIFDDHDVEEILEFGEFGVILLLFLIGLELRPQRLMSMRTDILGAGALQVAVTTVLIAMIGMLAGGYSLGQAVIIGGALALSSTAFVLQFLGEKGHLRQRYGRLGFSVLLFQDLAAIPLIAIIPLLSPDTANDESFSLLAIAMALGSVLLVLILGRYVLRYVYAFVAATGVPEGMTAAALLTVVVVALLMEMAGLSAALGAFLAGVLIGGSVYRHEIRANIAPFERILLGVFFTAVGMALDIGLIVQSPERIFALAFGLVAVKGIVLFAVGLWRGLKAKGALQLAVALSQGGEFAFVLFAISAQRGLIDAQVTSELAVAVTLSMALTPLLFWLTELATKGMDKTKHAADEMPDPEPGHVIIAGFGPFGQIAARILTAKGIPFTALEGSSERVDFVRRFGGEVYYGDPTRKDLLHAAEASRARALLVAVDDPDAAREIVEMAQRDYPDLMVLARARDRITAHELLDLGAEHVERETYLAALSITEKLLVELGETPSAAKRAVDMFKETDGKRFENDREYYKDLEKVRESARRAAKTLEEQFQRDRDESQGAAG